MSTSRFAIQWAAAGLMCVTAAAFAAPPAYVVSDLGIAPGATRVFVTSINNGGAVVGSYSFPNNVFRAWVWQNGSVRELPGHGGSITKAYGINDLGYVVGEASPRGIKFGRACMWNPAGAITDLGTLGGFGSWAISINNAGEIVGRSWILGNVAAHACSWRNGIIADLGVLPGPTNYYSNANAINTAGTIVGISDGTSGYPNPARWIASQPSNLAPAAVSGEALSVNDIGQVVGLMRWGQLDQATHFAATGPINLGRLPADTEGVCNDINNRGIAVGNSARPTLSRAVLWPTLTPNTQRDLNTLIHPASGWLLQDAMEINDNGCIVGTGLRNNLPRAFILIPRCVADFDDGTSTGNPDGGVNIDDMLFYFSLFQSGNPDADITDGRGNPTPDGGVNIDDLLFFLGRFEGGC